ncbi:MAG: cupin domain-containing protein, partial [Vicinamibacterales bacterium]|nr:cupin domain-containing protein [Vicinamibacterales bacterium]
MLRSVIAMSMVLVASPVWAQRATTVDPRHYTIVLENDVVRVLSVNYPPDERSEMHEHPPNVTVFLTDAQFRVTYPDGEVSNPRMNSGSVGWGAGTIHEPRSVGTQPVRVMIVEFVNLEISEGVRQRISQPEPIDLGPGMTGHALVDNELVAVRRVTFDPGAGREPHANENRNLLLMPRLGRLTVEMDGQTKILEPGEVQWVSGGTVHTERNDSDEPIEWIALLLEQL